MESVKALQYQTAEDCVMHQKNQQKVHIKLVQEKEQIANRKLTYLDGYMLCENMEALKPILSTEFRKLMKMLEFLLSTTGLLHLQIYLLIFRFS